jgi:hypothetical protein
LHLTDIFKNLLVPFDTWGSFDIGSEPFGLNLKLGLSAWRPLPLFFLVVLAGARDPAVEAHVCHGGPKKLGVFVRCAGSDRTGCGVAV